MQQLEGTHSVHEALRAGQGVIRILMDRQRRSDPAMQVIVQAAQYQQVVIEYVSRDTLDEESHTKRHQGVLAFKKGKSTVDYVDILNYAEHLGEPALIVVLDDIVDPHNVGAIIRSAEALGAHGLVMHDRRAAGITATVVRAAAGATEHLRIARVNNVPNVLRDLKERGVWILGMDAEGKELISDQDFTGPRAIVIGSEERGMSRVVKKLCDSLVCIPMRGRIQSLNASVAAAIVIWELVRKLPHADAQ